MDQPKRSSDTFTAGSDESSGADSDDESDEAYGNHKSLQDLQDFYKAQKSENSADYPAHLEQVRRSREALMKMMLAEDVEEKAPVSQASPRESKVKDQETGAPIRDVDNDLQPRKEVPEKPTVKKEKSLLPTGFTSSHFEIRALSHGGDHEESLQHIIDESCQNMVNATKTLYKLRSILHVNKSVEAVRSLAGCTSSSQVLASRNIVSQPILPSEQISHPTPEDRTSFSLFSLPKTTAPDMELQSANAAAARRGANISIAENFQADPFTGKSSPDSFGEKIGGTALSTGTPDNHQGDGLIIFSSARLAGYNNLDMATVFDKSGPSQLCSNSKRDNPLPDGSSVLSIATGKQGFQSADYFCGSMTQLDTVSKSSQTEVARELTGDVPQSTASTEPTEQGHVNEDTNEPIATPDQPDSFLFNLLNQKNYGFSGSGDDVVTIDANCNDDDSFDRSFEDASEDIHLAALADEDFWEDSLVAPPLLPLAVEPSTCARVVNYLQKTTADAVFGQMDQLNGFIKGKVQLDAGDPAFQRLGRVSFPLETLRASDDQTPTANPYDGFNARTISLYWNYGMGQFGEDHRRVVGMYSKFRLIEKTCQAILGYENVASVQLQADKLSPEVLLRLMDDPSTRQLWPQTSSVDFRLVKFLVVLPQEVSADVSEGALRDGLFQFRSIMQMRDGDVCILISGTARGRRL